jgi:hypothetical protein
MEIFRPFVFATVFFSGIYVITFDALANDDLKGMIAVQQAMIASLRSELEAMKLKLKAAEAHADDAFHRANAAQNTANDALNRASSDARNRADNAQNTANDALKLAGLAKTIADDAVKRVIKAQNTATEGVQKAGKAYNEAIMGRNRLSNEIYTRFSSLNGFRFENGRFVLPTLDGFVHIGPGGVCYYSGGRQRWCHKS